MHWNGKTMYMYITHNILYIQYKKMNQGDAAPCRRSDGPRICGIQDVRERGKWQILKMFPKEEKRLSNILFLSMKAKDSIDYVGPGRFDLFLF